MTYEEEEGDGELCGMCWTDEKEEGGEELGGIGRIDWPGEEEEDDEWLDDDDEGIVLVRRISVWLMKW